MTKITQNLLKELLTYDPLTGSFIWNKRDESLFKNSSSAKSWNTKYAGKSAGFINKAGYLEISIFRKKDGTANRKRKITQQGHIIAWLYYYGHFPKNTIDHINGNTSDNRIINLRDIEHEINIENVTKARKHNSTGVLGVTKCSCSQNYRARISVNKKQILIGVFKTIESASNAYLNAKRKLHKGCTI